MEHFEVLFSSFALGNLRLKNRILMAAMGNNFSHPDGTVSDRAIAYYRERAKGGAGLIITETCRGRLALEVLRGVRKMVGMETAEFLAQKGCRVTVVEMQEKLALDMEGTTRALLLARVASSKISVLVSATVKEVLNGRVRVGEKEGERWLEAETIILALGSQANQQMLRKLEGKGPQLILIGDCLEPRRAKEAIHEGFAAAMKI